MSWLSNQVPGVAVGVVLVAAALRLVTRARLERFARRQELEITVANGPVVIDYLATTRLWRVGGFLFGLAVSLGVGFTQRSTETGGATALVGWFVGALVAEWRLESRHTVPGRRSALLVARRIPDYLPRSFVLVSAAVWIATIALGVSDLVHQRPAQYAVIAELCAAMAVTPVTWLVARRVVARPRGLLADDVLAADDALRSRSVHVLAGCTLAINGILAALIETAAQRHLGNWLPDSGALVVDLAGIVALPLLGFIVGTAPFAARRVLAMSQSGVSA
jgi:hypothetical protein